MYLPHLSSPSIFYIWVLFTFIVTCTRCIWKDELGSHWRTLENGRFETDSRQQLVLKRTGRVASLSYGKFTAYLEWLDQLSEFHR